MISKSLFGINQISAFIVFHFAGILLKWRFIVIHKRTFGRFQGGSVNSKTEEKCRWFFIKESIRNEWNNSYSLFTYCMVPAGNTTYQLYLLKFLKWFKFKRDINLIICNLSSDLLWKLMLMFILPYMWYQSEIIDFYKLGGKRHGVSLQ